MDKREYPIRERVIEMVEERTAMRERQQFVKYIVPTISVILLLLAGLAYYIRSETHMVYLSKIDAEKSYVTKLELARTMGEIRITLGRIEEQLKIMSEEEQ